MHKLLQEIIDQSLIEETVCTEDLIFEAFKDSFNEQKGETIRTEISRWIEFIKSSYNIESVYHERKYYFRNIEIN